LTAQTIAAPEQLIRALEAIREQGFSGDTGEYADGVRASAAPVLDRFGDCTAALSVPFVDADDPARSKQIRDGVVDAASGVSHSIDV